MSISGNVEPSNGNLRTFAWIAFAMGAPQIIFLQHWAWFHDEYTQNANAALIDGLAQSLNGVVVICALLASLKVYSNSGKRLALATAGVWLAMLVLFQIGTFLNPPYWYDPIGDLKFMVGFTPTTPGWEQWANLGGTISTIIWIVIAIKLGKLQGTVPAGQVYAQGQPAFVTNTPAYQPVATHQGATQGNFCTQCGSKNFGSAGSFCSNCGSRL